MGKRSQKLEFRPIFSWSQLMIIIWLLSGNVYSAEENVARKAPFCIDADPAKGNLKYNTERFKPIIDHHNAINENVEVLSEPGGNNYIREIKLSRMVAHDVFEISHPMTNLRNWIHITIMPATDIMGLYIQAIKAPLGVPFGNFIIDFECNDCHDSDILENSKPVGQLVPCKGRPKSAARHPNVLVIAGNHLNTSYVKEKGFHFHFNWIEAPCDDVPIFQFLIIAVKSWGSTAHPGTVVSEMVYKVFYSPPYNNAVMDTATGVFWPLNPQWKNNKTLHCHVVGSNMGKEELNVKLYNENLGGIIKIDASYDACIRNNDMQNGYQCPPGPFKCPDFPITTPVWVLRRKGHINNSMKTCEVCQGSAITETPVNIQTLPPSEVPSRDYILHNFYMKNAKYFMQGVMKMHGILMVLCWTLLSSLSGYIVRFHKETSQIYPGTGCFAMGNFLWGHMAFSYLCVATMWAAVFLVALICYGSETDWFEIACSMAYESREKQEACANLKMTHVALGVIAMLFFHVNLALGWWRPSSQGFRNIYIFWHVMLGYGSKFIACGAAFATALPFHVLGWIVIAELLNFLLYLTATIIQLVADRNMNLDPKRTYCPVPQGINTFDDIPMAGLRICNLLSQYCIQTVCFIVFCIYYIESMTDMPETTVTATTTLIPEV